MHFRFVLEGITVIEMLESWRFEFLEKFFANSFALPEADDNFYGLLDRGGIADLPCQEKNTISKVRRYLKCTWRPIHTYKILIFKHKYSIFNAWKWPWLKKNIVYVLFCAEKIIYKMFHKALDIYLFSDNFSDYFFIKIVHFFWFKWLNYF